jgi:riboflavin kinase/FMN adenylyltransferase
MALQWRDERIEGSAVAIGIFDGVHQGHQRLIERARECNEIATALTFFPHPTALLAPEKEPSHLLTLTDRVLQLRLSGADAVAIAPFTEEFARISAEEFIDQVLIGELKASHIVVGENFRFGARAQGDVELLRSRKEFTTEVVPLVQSDDGVISSTRIRQLIRAGRVVTASEYLTRPHQIVGEVVHGEKRGREIGYPTANIGYDAKVTIPLDGIYAGWLAVDTRRWQAAISVGRNPHFPKDGGLRDIQVEAYAIDAGNELDLYGSMARVEFGYRLRDTMAFASLDELLGQMRIDVDEARRLTS